MGPNEIQEELCGRDTLEWIPSVYADTPQFPANDSQTKEIEILQKESKLIARIVAKLFLQMEDELIRVWTMQMQSIRIQRMM